MSLEVLDHQLARECDITWGFLVFPLLPVLVSCPTTFVCWRHTCRSSASCAFPLTMGAACPARCRQGPEFLASRVCKQPGRRRVQDGEKEKHLDMQGLAVTSWPGLVLCQVGTVQAPVCLLLPHAALLYFGFALFWICSWFLLRQEGPSDGGFMHVTKSDTQPRQEALASVCASSGLHQPCQAHTWV